MAPTSGAAPGRDTPKRSRDDSTDIENLPFSLEDVPPYDPSREQPPNSVTLSKEYETISKGMSYIRELLKDTFTTSSFADKHSKALQGRSEESFILPTPEYVIVGFVGDQGQGKSSLLMNVLQIGSIARAAGEGRSVTLFCSIFEGPKPGQDKPCMAVARLMDRQAYRDLLAYYVKVYYRVVHANEEFANEQEQAGAADPIELAEIQEQSTTIKSEVERACYSLFRNKIQCQTLRHTAEFLQGASSEDDPDVLNMIYNWADEIVRAATGDTGENRTAIVVASTAIDLKKRLEKYTTEADPDDGSNEPFLAPIVCLINYHFDDPIFRHGVKFMDNPGSSDMNRSRRLSAMKYVDTMTHALVVCDIFRAVDNSIVQSEVRSMQALGADRILVVATKTDVYNAEDGAKCKGHMDRGPDLSAKTDQEKKLKDEACEAISVATLRRDAQRIFELMEVSEIQTLKHKNAQKAEQAYRIAVRTESVKAELPKRLKDTLKSTKLVQVFGVSNAAYKTHLEGFAALDRPALSVEETEIPALRRTIFAFPNQARLREISHAVNVTVPAMLSGLKLYASRNPAERNAGLHNHISGPQTKHVLVIEAVFRHLKEKIAQDLLNPLREEEETWNKQAKAKCLVWVGDLKTRSEFTTDGFRNLMRNSGIRKRGKSRAVDLSAELNLSSCEKIMQLFEAISPVKIGFGNSMTAKMEKIFSDMVLGIERDQDFLARAGFIKHLEDKRPELREKIRKSVAGLSRALEAISENAAFTKADSYIVAAMAPVYKQVSQITRQSGQTKGLKGVGQYRGIVFTDECSQSGGVWTRMCDAIEQKIGSVLKEEEEKLKKEIGAIFEGWQETFEATCDAPRVAGPEEKQFQESLLKTVDLCRKELTEMKTAADELHRQFHTAA